MFSFMDFQLFTSDVSPAQGRVALDGLWPSPSHTRQGNPPASLRKLSLPNPACSGEAQLTSHSSLSRWGRQHGTSLTSGRNHGFCCLQTPKPKLLQGRPSPGANPARTLQEEWGVHSPLAAAWRKHFSSHWNVKVRVLMKNTRWHSYAIKKIHHTLAKYKEFRFFPSFKKSCLKYTIQDRFSHFLSQYKLWTKKDHLQWYLNTCAVAKELVSRARESQSVTQAIALTLFAELFFQYDFSI